MMMDEVRRVDCAALQADGDGREMQDSDRMR
jgi:hypothetical protein